MNLPFIFWYLQALLTPVIGAVAVYIANQQWQTKALKSKLDLFDRRFRVFDETKKFLALMFTAGVKDEEELRKFLAETAGVEFLFGPEIKEYRKEIRRRAQRLSFAREQAALEQGASVDEGKRLSEIVESEVNWATAEIEMIADKFRKYLDMSKL